ncbi:MAG: hypothetical protein QOD68_1845 [Actinomycetota bacterium]|nr:hypothetical protein [Actinomycetota bacterium]
MTDARGVDLNHAPEAERALSRRGFLGVGAGLLGAGALSAAGVAGATVAEAAGGDRALHLVRRTTYGPTPELLATVRKIGPDAWLERQLHPGKVPDAAMTALLRRWPTLRMTPAQLTARIGKFQWDGMFDLCDAHIARAAWSNRQLFEVMVDFWSNHLNVTCPSSDVWSTRHLYDAQVIRRHALGRFSDMLVASAKHPAMLTYLDNASSDKDAPNENYARELLELHTVGVGAGYTEAMVKSAARLLTGLSVDDRTGAYLYDTSKHATGPVRVLGFTDPNRSTYGEKVAVAYLRYLAKHPATARHLARKLAVRFVSDAPSAALVAHLAKVYLAHDTAIVPVLRALFRSREFARSAGDKVKRPFEDLVSTVRALGIRPPASGTEGVRQLYWMSGDLGQPPLGWHPPDGYPDAAAAWQSAGGTLARWNAHLGLAAGWWPNDLRHPGLASRLRPAHPRTHGALVDAAAAGLGLPRPTAAVRDAICTFLSKSAGSALSADDQAMGWRLPYVFGLLLDSPAAAVR